jgi:glyoxylate/hydroxypyruvate reductase A
MWPDLGKVDDIKYAAVGRIPPGELAKLPNLKLIFNLFAGVEALKSDPLLPKVPIERTDDPTGDRSMSEVVLLHVLRHHRQMPAYALAQSQREWISLFQPWTEDRKVGVLGLGPLGMGAATTLSQYGFDVAAWTRSARAAMLFPVFNGRDSFLAFLQRTEILVNLLPLNPETQCILNRSHLGAMPKSASLINLGRGGHVIDRDLIELLDEGHLDCATLDVFHQEPLPKSNPLVSIR